MGSGKGPTNPKLSTGHNPQHRLTLSQANNGQNHEVDRGQNFQTNGFAWTSSHGPNRPPGHMGKILKQWQINLSSPTNLASAIICFFCLKEVPP
ncbi:hypothetical protein HKD37_U058982 [Glycine soja]